MRRRTLIAIPSVASRCFRPARAHRDFCTRRYDRVTLSASPGDALLESRYSHSKAKQPIGADTLACLGLGNLKYLEEPILRSAFERHAVDEQVDVQGVQSLLAEQGFPEPTRKAAERVLARLDGDGDGKIDWEELKAVVDLAAGPVDRRVRPIYGSLTLSFVAQGVQFPVLPQLARSLDLTTADVGLLSSATALARIASNFPAAALAERYGRRPLLIAGPAMSAVGMGILSASSSFVELAIANAFVGCGLPLRFTATHPPTGVHTAGSHHPHTPLCCAPADRSYHSYASPCGSHQPHHRIAIGFAKALHLPSSPALTRHPQGWLWPWPAQPIISPTYPPLRIVPRPPPRSCSQLSSDSPSGPPSAGS